MGVSERMGDGLKFSDCLAELLLEFKTGLRNIKGNGLIYVIYDVPYLCDGFSSSVSSNANLRYRAVF